MGLELTEIMMRCEEDFQIEIEEDAIEIRTVGDLYHYVLKKIDAGVRTKCATATGFFRFRSALLRITEHKKNEIRPDSRIADLIPRGRLKSQWYELERTSNLPLPDLNHIIPQGVLAVPAILFGLPLAATVVIGIGLLMPESAIMIGILGAFAVFFVPSVLFIGLGRLSPRTYPDNVTTVLDLIRNHWVNYLNRLDPEGRQWTPTTVWIAIRDNIADTLPINADDIRPEHDLVQDLGAG